ncbi:protein NRT1/ PTR FAMILY 5.2-like [Iris pallida]|uniref:Protein NRT1/ PTR FAMILY 5.2-like n=1 Tax=Iris pallida TaxID=29817 RepID=A0AAX6DQT1_IRIPA|nr:protein NRT1/ PTR FAMILY 5.2-like [Iris pallida]
MFPSLSLLSLSLIFPNPLILGQLFPLPPLEIRCNTSTNEPNTEAITTASTSSSVSASRPLPFGTNESIWVKVLMSVIQYSILGAWAKLGVTVLLSMVRKSSSMFMGPRVARE